jgi:hypothetical protein
VGVLYIPLRNGYATKKLAFHNGVQTDELPQPKPAIAHLDCSFCTLALSSVILMTWRKAKESFASKHPEE